MLYRGMDRARCQIAFNCDPLFAANADPLQVARVTPLTEPRPASRSLT